MSPSERIREFPKEKLSNVLGKLFCNACRENISVKKSVISQHIKGARTYLIIHEHVVAKD